MSIRLLTDQQKSELLVHKAMLQQERILLEDEYAVALSAFEKFRERHFPIFQELFAHKQLLKVLKRGGSFKYRLIAICTKERGAIR